MKEKKDKKEEQRMEGGKSRKKERKSECVLSLLTFLYMLVKQNFSSVTGKRSGFQVIFLADYLQLSMHAR